MRMNLLLKDKQCHVEKDDINTSFTLTYLLLVNFYIFILLTQIKELKLLDLPYSL